jgi:hypothetical protein
MNTQKIRDQTDDRFHDDPNRIEWRAFVAVLREAFECAIEYAISRAVALAVDFPEDIRALDHLRDVVAARFEGRTAPMRTPDLLHALGILLAAFEVDSVARTMNQPTLSHLHAA